jgi:chromosome segregation protein
VIFAGSSRRKPLGMAEVSLTVDNEDRFLPLDFAEVTVTRRIYRSGEGEYLLNRVPCRLKDITDLFLDTGVGRGAYAIVNQSEIDAILSARPEDRRELFEEAAGIKKYRTKKREAQRKLEHTQANLLRVRDIVNELSGQLGPLEAQAKTARRYEELTARLREIEVGLLAFEWARFAAELRALEETVAAAVAEAEGLRDEAARLEASAAGLGQRIVDAEAEMDRGRLLQQTALAQGERIEGQIALGAERRAAAERAAETLARDLALLDAEKARLEQGGGHTAPGPPPMPRRRRARWRTPSGMPSRPPTRRTGRCASWERRWRASRPTTSSWRGGWRRRRPNSTGCAGCASGARPRSPRPRNGPRRAPRRPTRPGGRWKR